MVSVAERGHRDAPGLRPIHPMLIDQQAHQLGYSDCRMRVVQLDGGVIGQCCQCFKLDQVACDQILQRGGGKEELLAQAQLLAGFGVVARIQNAGDSLGAHAVAQRAHVVAAVELLQVQRLGRARGPQAQRIGVVAASADHGGVIGDRREDFRGIPDIGGPALGVGAGADRAAEPNDIGHLGPHELPRVSDRKPVVRQLALHAAGNLLAEQSIVVAYPVAESRDAQACHAVHEAGGESPQAAIAQGCVRLLLAHRLDIGAQRGQRLTHRLQQSQVPCGVEHQPPDQKLQRQIIDALGAGLAGLGRGQPALDDEVADRVRRGDEPVALRCPIGSAAHFIGELVEDTGAQCFLIAPATGLTREGQGLVPERGGRKLVQLGAAPCTNGRRWRDRAGGTSRRDWGTAVFTPPYTFAPLRHNPRAHYTDRASSGVATCR